MAFTASRVSTTVIALVALWWRAAQAGETHEEGRSWVAVQGVRPDDILNVRSQPGPRTEVVGTIPPDARVLVLEGHRRLGSSVWREVAYLDMRGWVNSRFLGQGAPSPPTRRHPDPSPRRRTTRALPAHVAVTGRP
jgi:hypothetical protein